MQEGSLRRGQTPKTSNNVDQVLVVQCRHCACSPGNGCRHESHALELGSGETPGQIGRALRGELVSTKHCSIAGCLNAQLVLEQESAVGLCNVGRVLWGKLSYHAQRLDGQAFTGHHVGMTWDAQRPQQVRHTLCTQLPAPVVLSVDLC